MRANANNINQMMLRRTLAPSDPILALFAGGEQGLYSYPTDQKAPDGDYISFTDAGGTIPASKGDKVRFIRNLAGDNHFVQQDISKGFLLETDGNRWWWENDGVDDEMVQQNTITTGGGFYAAIAFNVLSEGGDNSSADVFGVFEGGNRQVIGWRSSGIYSFASQVRFNVGSVFSAGFLVDGGSGSFGTPLVGEGWHDTSSITTRLSTGQEATNPAEISETDIGTVLLRSDSNYRVYGLFYRTNTPPPSAGDRNMVRDAFAARAGASTP